MLHMSVINQHTVDETCFSCKLPSQCSVTLACLSAYGFLVSEDDDVASIYHAYLDLKAQLPALNCSCSTYICDAVPALNCSCSTYICDAVPALSLGHQRPVPLQSFKPTSTLQPVIELDLICIVLARICMLLTLASAQQIHHVHVH